MSIQEPELNISLAASTQSSEALGPGKRAILWVRGCNRRCKGCIAPQWWKHESKVLVSTIQVAEKLLIGNPEVRGLTISGGEPFLQAEALVEMIRYARTKREFDVISYSGYTLEQLQQSGLPGALEMLSEIDVLIDGDYQQDIPANDGIRGSLNQVIHFLGHRITPEDFYRERNHLEIYSKYGDAMMVGVPTPQQLKTFNQAVDRFIVQTGSGLKPISVGGGGKE